MLTNNPCSYGGPSYICICIETTFMAKLNGMYLYLRCPSLGFSQNNTELFVPDK